MGTSLKGKNWLWEQILSFKSSFLWYDKSLLPHWVTSLECYYFYYACAYLRNGSYANDFVCLPGVLWLIFLWLFLTVPLVDLQCVIVIFPDHTHFFVKIVKNKYPQIFIGNVILSFIMHYKRCVGWDFKPLPCLLRRFKTRTTAGWAFGSSWT